MRMNRGETVVFHQNVCQTLLQLATRRTSECSKKRVLCETMAVVLG